MSTALTMPGAGLPTQHEWATMVTMGQSLHKSGLLPRHITNADAAVAIILQGRELGIGPLQALRTIHLIEGKLTLSADLMAALIYHRCGDEALRVVERSAKRCVIDYKRPGWAAPARMEWTFEMAQRAGLAGKDNWKRHTEAMLYARCISAIGHTAFQDVIMGLYTPDEAEEIAASEGPQAREAAAVTVEPAGRTRAAIVTVDTQTGEVIEQRQQQQATQQPAPDPLRVARAGLAGARDAARMAAEGRGEADPFPSSKVAAVVKAAWDIDNPASLSLHNLADLRAWVEGRLEWDEELRAFVRAATVLPPSDAPGADGLQPESAMPFDGDGGR